MAASRQSGRTSNSRFYLTLARGKHIRCLGLRPLTFYLAATGVLTLAGSGLYAGASSLLAQPQSDRVIRALQAQTQADYEDRLAALRQQMDLAAQASARDRQALESKMSVLERRQAELDSRAQEIDRLAQLATPGAIAPSARTEATPPQPKGASTDMRTGKPHPGGMVLRSDDDHASALDAHAGALLPRLAALDADASRVKATQDQAIASLAKAANRSAKRVSAALALAGLSVDRLRGKAWLASGGEGGPFIPVKLDQGDTSHATLVKLEDEIVTDSKLATALPYLPFRHPLRGRLEVTSPFGMRVDPFLGRLAEHTGEDLRAAIGDPVLATGGGKVDRAGYDGGYGNMVEIDHGDGIVTRYGHLSAIAVKAGQRVTAGQIVGYVGTTGRSTGPHLHYEVRVDGQPVDPSRFLRAGDVLTASR